jgi:hypothetical protein
MKSLIASSSLLILFILIGASSAEGVNMINQEDVTGLAITLKVEDDLSLLVLVAADGSINRLGTGTVNNTEKEMFIGVTDPMLFKNMRPHINSDVIRWIGARADQAPKGKICELTIWLFLPNKEERAIYFKYGSESMGPPPEISRLVLAAIEITNPWYEEFKGGAAKKGAAT